MVKLFLVLSLLVTFSFGGDVKEKSKPAVKQDLLELKIKNLLSPKSYKRNKNLIKVIFRNKSAYYKNSRVNSLKVARALKRNGLLKLFFRDPKNIKLNFKTNGTPLFFVKIMGDSLRNIGYYRYVTHASSLDESEFSWSIVLKAESVTDPFVLEKELRKSRCHIVDISRVSATEWSYSVDISKAVLNVNKLVSGRKVEIKRAHYAQWLNVSRIKKLVVVSNERNRWYPSIVYYDRSLHILKVVRKDRVLKKIVLKIPSNARYMKLADLYTMKNIHDELVLYPKGRR